VAEHAARTRVKQLRHWGHSNVLRRSRLLQLKHYWVANQMTRELANTAKPKYRAPDARIIPESVAIVTIRPYSM